MVAVGPGWTMEKLVSCRHTEDGATREALKPLWLAGTDAVREPRYAVLLEQTYSVVGGLTVCGPGCALKLILGGMSQPHPSGPRPAVELLMRIMDNDECPEELLRWALGVASVEDVQVGGKFAIWPSVLQHLDGS